MTERLYYTEPYRIEFDATVRAAEPHDRRVHVVLDRTAFYPTSGGQPFDTGTLGAARVIDVVDRDDGDVEHVVEGTLEAGARVRGLIDWARRFDHMQQHTGQHVLSAAFEHTAGVRTVSFHLGRDVSTIDLAREAGEGEIARAMDEANRVVWEDRPVAIRFATEEEAARLPLRKEPVKTGTLRLIEVEGFDLSACGGTHVARTGAIGIIAVVGWERFRGGLRVEFVCGGRALAAFTRYRDTVSGAIRAISVAPHELPGAVERLQADNKDLRRAIKQLQERLAGYEADSVAQRGIPAGDRTVVVEALEGYDAQGLKALATAVAARAGHAVALFSAAAPHLAVIARAPGVPADAGAALRALIARFGGKGGGKPDLAQGGGLTGAIDEILSEARKLLAP